MRAAFLLLAWLLGGIALPAAASEAMIDALIEEARSAASASPCDGAGQDGLERVMCRWEILIVVLTNYPGFGTSLSGAGGDTWIV